MLIDILARIDALYWPCRNGLDARRRSYRPKLAGSRIATAEGI